MKLAGVVHHSSYEWNPHSNRTHNFNFGTHNSEVDIRALELSDLPPPRSIDIVVGSPPCTQFSYSNKGGKGDIEDGLVDIHKFLTIVEYLKPKYWAMENVPRVKQIIDELVVKHPKFQRFKKMITFNEVVNAWEFGTPQKRMRMVCGNFPSELFMSYREKCPKYSMKDVLTQLVGETQTDAVYGWPRGIVTDHEKEVFLNEEEVRINRESKLYHPVYNRMAFPDPLDRPSRTVTSLCTRVSRESIVIEDQGHYRRLTVRERAVLMGFPVSYQFYGTSYSEKLKMIGNAIPPLITFHLFNAMIGREYLPLKSQKNYVHIRPKEEVPKTSPPIPKQKYSANRSFRFCLPGFRYGSGVRFELSNTEGMWRIRFFYGSSKNIVELPLDEILEERLRHCLPKKCFLPLPKHLSRLTSNELQQGWISKSDVNPLKYLDDLGEYGKAILELLQELHLPAASLEKLLPAAANRSILNDPERIIAGMIAGTALNKNMERNESQ